MLDLMHHCQKAAVFSYSLRIWHLHDNNEVKNKLLIYSAVLLVSFEWLKDASTRKLLI